MQNALFLCYVVYNFIISCLSFLIGPTRSVVDAEPTLARPITADVQPTLNCVLGAARHIFTLHSL